MFQSPIGTNKTHQLKGYCLHVDGVSIPYRYKQNNQTKDRDVFQTKFQSPIGTNKTNLEPPPKR